jgi:hypothetical protein
MYLLPLTGVLLAVALVGLGLQAKNKSYGPLALGVVSAGTILPGKFLLASSTMTYAGAGLLVIASAWSLLPARPAVSSCPTCATPGEGQSV